MKLSLMILWEKVFLWFVSMRERHLITEAPGRRKQRDGIWNVVTLITNNNENGMKGENYINYYTWMFKKNTGKIWIFLQCQNSCINSKTLMLYCVHSDGNKFNNYFSVVQVCVCVQWRGWGWQWRQHSVRISSLSLFWQPVQWRLTCWSGLIMKWRKGGLSRMQGVINTSTAATVRQISHTNTCIVPYAFAQLHKRAMADTQVQYVCATVALWRPAP